MDLVELGAIGELVGGVAVVASLIYVAVQVRQSNENSRQSIEMEKSAASRDTGSYFTELMMVTKDPSLMEALQRATVDFDSLSHVDKGRISMWLTSLEIQALSVFVAGQSNLMEEATVEAWLGYFASFVKTPGLNKWWQTSKGYYHPAFVSDVDARLVASDGPLAIHLGVPWIGPELS